MSENPGTLLVGARRWDNWDTGDSGVNRLCEARNDCVQWEPGRGRRVPDANARGTYLVIAAALREKIDRDTTVSETLPSEARLVQAYGASRTTIRRALETLAAEGLIESHPGRGWHVVAGRSSEARMPLAERLTALLAERQLAVGDKIPAESELCELFGVSRTSLRRALGQLEGAGLLEAKQGKGRFVRALPPMAGTS